MGSAPWQPADLDSSRPVVDVVVFNWRPVAVRPDATLCAACLRLVNGSGRRMYCALHVDQVYISAARASLCAADFFLLCRLSIYFMPAAGCNIVGWRNERSPWQSEAAEMCPLTV